MDLNRQYVNGSADRRGEKKRMKGYENPGGGRGGGGMRTRA